MAEQNQQSELVSVGPRLRQMRETRGISMRALARLSGLSANALSMIERGKTSPSVSTLYKLADALELPITAFFRVAAERKPVVFRRMQDRSGVAFPKGQWFGLGGESFSGRVEPLFLSLEPGADSGTHDLDHTGHEFVLCLEGLLEYTVEGESFLMRPGDSLLFAARLRHCWRNAGEGKATAVIVLSGFEQHERPSEFHYSAVS